MSTEPNVDRGSGACDGYRDFANLTTPELRSELLKLQTLAIAVGQCGVTDVPEAVMKAWQEPLNYRLDELHWLRSRYNELLEAVARVIRQHDQGTLASQGDSSAIEKLRAIVNVDPSR